MHSTVEPKAVERAIWARTGMMAALSFPGAAIGRGVPPTLLAIADEVIEQARSRSQTSISGRDNIPHTARA